MLLTILSSWVYVEKRKLFQVIPEPLLKIWNDWELRAMVLISLFLQISLIIYGSRRKYSVRTWIRVFLWFAYLVADWVATVALGVLSSDKGNKCSCHANEHDRPVSALAAFWGPFLLLHLGGPDTITAYALEDNELWMRHLLGLVVQSGVALYVFLMAWNVHSWISFLSIPMLISGFIKYIERLLVLRSANREQFRDSMLTCPDPGPNYEKFMEELCIRRAEGHYVKVDLRNDFHLDAKCLSHDSEANLMVKAHSLFQNFKRLFVDLILSFRDRDESQAYIQTLTADQAFQVVEIELGFAYDVFYTKAPFIYTYWGCIFRLVTISFTTITFALLVVFERNENHHEKIDLGISYALLVGAIVLEIYGALLIASSDWTSLSLVDKPSTLYPGIMSRLHQLTCIQRRKRWSNSVAQFNLLSYCLKTKEKSWAVQPITKTKCFIPFGLIRCVFNNIDQLEMLWYQTHYPITSELTSLVFSHLCAKSPKPGEEVDLTLLCNKRGGDHLVDKDPNSSISEWTTEIEFDQSILIWHIATDLLLHDNDKDNDLPSRRVSKSISNYMLYILVMCPYMLPFGIGVIRFRDTLAEASQFFQERRPVEGKREACGMLREVNTSVAPKQVKGDRSKSVVFDACRLAAKVREWEEEKRWRVVSEVWMEMLGYAASKCRGYFHAQQLRRGGEFLTHVWLLMAHLGITEQIQISKGHARAMLIAK